MKKALLVIIGLLVSACSSTVVNNPEEVNDALPDWMLEAPVEEESFFSTGVGVSTSLQLASDKAILNAKRSFADRIEGVVSSKTKEYTTETNGVANSTIERTTTNIVAEAYLSGYSVKDTVVQTSDDSYRVLCPLGIQH